MSESGSSVVLKKAKHRIGVDLIAGAIQIAATVVAANVVAVRGDGAEIIQNAMSSRADVEDRI